MANNELGKYLRYAIGEIFLVVVGILIALQINNWNEDRIEQIQIREFTLSLADDLQSDIEMLKSVRLQIDHFIHLSNELADYVRGKSLAEIYNIDLYVYTVGPGYRPFEWKRAALDQLKSSGALRQIKNQLLVQKISEYDAQSRHLDQDYSNDENKIREAQNVALKVVDMSYPERNQIPMYVDETTDDALADFFKSDLYQEIKSNDLALLSSDLSEVRHAVNTYIETGMNLDPRTSIEIPWLMANGLEIIALIHSEYGEQ